MSASHTPMATGTFAFYDDARARTFEPFALSRPFCEMRVGALLIRERWEFALRQRTISFVGAAQLEDFIEEGAPRFAGDTIPAGTILVNARAAVALWNPMVNPMPDALSDTPPADDAASASRAAITPRSWYVDGRIAATRLTHDVATHDLRDGTLTLDEIARQHAGAHLYPPVVMLEGVWIDEVWDIVRHLSSLLITDIPDIASDTDCGMVTGATTANAPVVTGVHGLHVEHGATIEPFTFFDTTLGPVLVRNGSTVQAFTRVVGPCYIGRDCVVTADRISGCSIGDTCRVHGELSSTVFIGQSNKGHDGFVGHSIVGRWVNMGAGTITSNLKNTYGTVALWTPDGIRDTGMQFLGTLFGDHVKTGIGLTLTTGCVLGMAANVFNAMPPKVVEPFAWGSHVPYESYDAEKFLATAARMMSRRHVELTADACAHLRTVYAARWFATATRVL